MSIADQQDRLTALVNVLGFTSLDHLEDYVILHGAARVVPAASSLALYDTQTQPEGGYSYSGTRHAQRNDERKREILRLTSQVDQLRKELDWLRREHEKHIDTVERLRKDKIKLLDLVEDAEGRADARGGPIDDGFAALVAQTSTLFDHVDELDEVIFDLERQNVTLAIQIETTEQAHENLLADYDAVQAEFSETTAELEAVRFQLEDSTAEIDRLKTIESAFEKFKGLLEPLTAVAAQPSPRPIERHSPVTGLSSVPRPRHPLPRSGLATATPETIPDVQSRLLRHNPAHLSSPKTPNNPPMSTPNTHPAQTASAAAGSSTSLHHPLSPPATSTVVPTANPSSSASSPSIHVPDVATPSAAATGSHAGVTAVLSASTSVPFTAPRLTSVQARQLKQYPLVLASYLTAVGSFSSPQTWAEKVIPGLDRSVLSSYPPPPPVPTYPSSEFPTFDPLPLAKGPDMGSRSPWIEDGTLGQRYEDLEECEKRVARRLADWKVWINGVRTTVRVQEDGNGTGTDIEKEKDGDRAVSTPTGTKTLVKKKRRVSRGVEAPSTAAVVSPCISTNPAFVATVLTAQASTYEPPLRRNTVQAESDADRGDTQLLASPTRPVVTSNPVAAPSTSKKKKTWNLLSPKKKSTAVRSTVSPVKSPRTWSQARGEDPLVLVDETQPQAVAEHCILKTQPAPPEREFESEPDTLRSMEEVEPDTIPSSDGLGAPTRRSSRLRPRSVSPMPRKQASSFHTSPRFSPNKKSPLRRTSAVAHDLSSLGPKPPFSPSYAAKMADEAHNVSRSSVPVEFLVASDPSRKPFQPSPNRRRSRPSRSPSSSPSKESLAVPPSAQPMRLYHGDDFPSPDPRAKNASAEAIDVDNDARGLLFSTECSLSPGNQRDSIPGGKQRRARVSEGGGDKGVAGFDPFVDAHADAGAIHAKPRNETLSLSPKKKKQKKRKSDGQDEGRSLKRSRKSLQSVGLGPQHVLVDDDAEKHDVKPNLDLEERHSSEDIGSMPMGSAEEAARRLWIQKIQTKRHEKIVKMQQEKAVKSPRVQLELNPDRNQGQKHAFKQTERKKAVRQSMVAEACGNCKAYYDRKKQPVPTGHCNHVVSDEAPSSKTEPKGGWLDTRAAEAEKRLQKDGRHRAAQRAVPEPPDYWQMGFPDTQQAEKINARAKQLRAEQDEYKRIEAEQANGLYRFRNELTES